MRFLFHALRIWLIEFSISCRSDYSLAGWTFYPAKHDGIDWIIVVHDENRLQALKRWQFVPTFQANELHGGCSAHCNWAGVSS